jgi:uncharacterized BrkB/YihY/UPF0761 family membrane protein
MKILGIGAYFIVLLVLAVIALAPISGFGTWSNANQPGHAFDIPSYARTVSLILLLVLISGGVFYFFRAAPSLE